MLEAIKEISNRLSNLEQLQTSKPLLHHDSSLDSDDSDEEQSVKIASTGKHWGTSTFQELRRTFDISNNLSDVELLNFVLAKTLKIYSTYEALKSKIQTLLMR